VSNASPAKELVLESVCSVLDVGSLIAECVLAVVAFYSIWVKYFDVNFQTYFSGKTSFAKLAFDRGMFFVLASDVTLHTYFLNKSFSTKTAVETLFDVQK
jgi:hypothetical protein